jgi:hypothetical protein
MKKKKPAPTEKPEPLLSFPAIDFHDLEKRAMLAASPGNHDVLILVSAFRVWRAATIRLMDSRFSDGACGNVAITDFLDELVNHYEGMVDGTT